MSDTREDQWAFTHQIQGWRCKSSRQVGCSMDASVYLFTFFFFFFFILRLGIFLRLSDLGLYQSSLMVWTVHLGCLVYVKGLHAWILCFVLVMDAITSFWFLRVWWDFIFSHFSAGWFTMEYFCKKTEEKWMI
jgi:hypothetical protein